MTFVLTYKCIVTNTTYVRIVKIPVDGILSCKSKGGTGTIVLTVEELALEIIPRNQIHLENFCPVEYLKFHNKVLIFYSFQCICSVAVIFFKMYI